MRKHGFTLVEVILSIALFGLIAVTFIPAMATGYRNLVDSEQFVLDSYVSQQSVELLLEEKRKEVIGTEDIQTISVFGVNVTGHLISASIDTHGEINVFQPQRTVNYDVPEIIARGHAGNPDVLLDVVSVSPRPTEISMFNNDGSFNSTVELLVNQNNFQVDDPTIYLMSVYKWFVSSEQEQQLNNTLDNYFVVKEWNAARGVVTYTQSLSLKTTPNIQNTPDYNRLTLNEVKTGLNLTNEGMINAFGNRYIYFSVTPFAISGRIGDEDLSNAIYINAPRIEIDRARFGADAKQVEILFKEAIAANVDINRIEINEDLGTLLSAQRSLTNDKLLVLTFEDDLDGSTVVTGNALLKGAVNSNTYGNISIWSAGDPRGRFNIDLSTAVYPTSISISPETVTLMPTATATLTPTILPNDTTDKSVIWLSSNETIATVNSAGVVTANAPGTATITAKTSDGRFSDTAVVTVMHAAPGLQVYRWPSSMILKLDASLGVNAATFTWNDLSGYGNNFTQTTGVRKPLVSLNALNGMPMIKFSDAITYEEDFLTSNTSTLVGPSTTTENLFADSTNQFSVFVVGKSTNQNDTFFSKASQWGSNGVYAIGKYNNYFGQVLRGNTSNTSTGDTGFKYHSSIWNGSVHKYYLNGNLVSGHNNIGTASVDNSNFLIGAVNSGTQQHLEGQIGEILVFNDALSDSDRSYIESYLKYKWFTAPTENWSFDTSLEGWGTPLSISGFAQSSGAINGTLTGSDPYFHSPDNLSIDSSVNDLIMIRLKNNTASTAAQIFFTTNTSTDWQEAKHVDFQILPNSGYTDYLVDMSANGNWTGTIKSLRIDPTTGVSSGTFSIDFIRVIKSGL